MITIKKAPIEVFSIGAADNKLAASMQMTQCSLSYGIILV
jgi:hypothetical protein